MKFKFNSERCYWISHLSDEMLFSAIQLPNTTTHEKMDGEAPLLLHFCTLY